jgi:hypothetical protein
MFGGSLAGTMLSGFEGWVEDDVTTASTPTAIKTADQRSGDGDSLGMPLTVRIDDLDGPNLESN